MTAILLTGPPGCGKTTIIRRIVASLTCQVAGFYTQDLRGADGRRVGFEAVTLDGQRATIAHVDFQGPHRVGKYGVDVAAIDRVAVPAVRRAIAKGADMIVIDEIGPMELLSAAFRAAVLEAVASPSVVLGTVVMRSHSWADGLKERGDVRMVAMDRGTADCALREVERLVAGALVSGS